MPINGTAPPTGSAPAPFDQSDCDYSEMLRFERRFGQTWGGWTLLQVRRVLTLNLFILISAVLIFIVILRANIFIAGGYIVAGLVFGLYRSLKQVKDIDLKKGDKTQRDYLKDRKIVKRGGPWMGNRRVKDHSRVYEYELCVQSVSVRPRRRRSKGVTR